MAYTLHDTVVDIHSGVEIADGMQLVFRNRAEQESYFVSKRITNFTEMLYVTATSGTVKLQGNTGAMWRADYISFINPSFENRSFYCKIISTTQIAAEIVEVNFVIDWWQTMMFDVKYLPSEIEREHLSDADQAATAANPYNMDILELQTPEDLPVTDDMELTYKRGDTGTWITDNGKATGSKYRGTTAIEPAGVEMPANGAPGLNIRFGNGSPFDTNDVDLVMQLAHWDEYGDFLDEVGIPNLDLGTRSGIYEGFARAYHVVVFKGTNAERGATLKKALDYLTLNGLTMQILGVYALPKGFMMYDQHLIANPSNIFGLEALSQGFPPQNIMVTNHNYTASSGYEPMSPKLYRAPYRMIRVTTPGGEEHNFAVEHFGSAGIDHTFTFKLYHNFDDLPSQTLIPMNYSGYSGAFKDRMVYETFPQVGYTVDGYLSFLNSKYTSLVQSETAPGRAQREAVNSNRVLRKLSQWKDMGLSGASQEFAVKRLDPTFAQQWDSLGLRTPGMMEAAEKENQRMQMDDADSFRKGNMNASALRSGTNRAAGFEHMRSTTQADAYFAGNAQGSLGMRLNQNYWEMTLVTMRPAFLKVYDEHFQMFGYTSGRMGIPRVAEWAQTGENKPWFGPHGTYVKTTDLKVYGAPTAASLDIADLFNKGCRFKAPAEA